MDLQSLKVHEINNMKNTEKRASKAVLVCLCACSLMFLMQLGVSLLFAFILPLFPFEITNIMSYFIDLAMYIIYIAVPFGVAALIFKSFFKFDYNFVKRSSPKYPPLYIFGAVGVGYLVNLVINIIFAPIIEYFAVDSAITAEGPWEILLCYVLYAVAPAILEEWAFRGVLLKNLLPYGKGGAIIISSLLFGIAHVDLPRIVFATAIGLVFAVCYEYTGSLKIPMLIHFINNAISVTISLIPEDSIAYLLFSQVALAIIGCGIAAIIVYANKGIERKKISLIKPKLIGYKLPIGRYLTKFALNFGMIPYVILYIIYFILIYVA